jgi:carboxyl-terminal processing protease
LSALRRIPLLAGFGLLLVIALVAGVWWGGHPEDLPGFARRTFLANHETSVVNEALGRIHREYYRPLSERQLANASLAGVVASLHDRFSHYLTPSEYRSFNKPASFSGIGVEVDPIPRGLRIVQVFNSSPAARAGLKAEEVIVAAAGRRLAGLQSTKATELVKGPADTNVTLRVQGKRDGRKSTRTVTVTRATVSEPVVASATRTVHGVKLGIVALAEFTSGAAAEVREAVEHELHAEHARGLVFDLRGNGGGLVEEAQLIASIFLPHGKLVVSMRGRTVPTEVLRALGGAIPTSVPMVVLVDRNTASSAEIVTGALQDNHRASVVGTHTFGKGVFQEEQGLSNGGALDITVGEYFTPNGRNLGGGGVREGAGITPEVLLSHGVDSYHGLAVALSTLAAKVK